MRVHIGAEICKKKLSQIKIPEKCLIVSVQREDNEIVPNGNTIIKSGDTLIALCDEFDSVQVNHALEKQCRLVRK